jgi:hypothetical protein
MTGGGRHPPPWCRQFPRPRFVGETREIGLARRVRTALCAHRLAPRSGRRICPPPAARHRALWHRPRAPRHLRRAHGAHVRRAVAEICGRHVRALPRLRGPRARLPALPLRRLWSRRAGLVFLQGPRRLSELRRAPHVQRGGATRRSRLPQRARQAIGFSRCRGSFAAWLRRGRGCSAPWIASSQKRSRA